MKLIGKITLVLLSLVLVTSLILWALAKNINPETIKKIVSTQITTLTHKKSSIDGAISWQLFPRPGLKFSKILIGDEALNDEYSLAIDTMLLNLKITPLLRGNFVFSEVNIDGLKAQINLDTAQVAQLPENSSNNKYNKDNKSEQFAIESLLIRQGQIIINKNGHSTIFKNLQIGVEQFNLQNNPFAVQIKTKLNEYNSNPQVKASINFKGRLSLTPAILNQPRSIISQSSAEGLLLLQNVLLNQLSIKKISATIKTKKEGILFNPLTFTLYNGESIGNMDYAIATQQFSLNQTATNLDGKQLITILLGHEMISGSLDYSIHATIPLEKPNIENSSGKGTITIKDGEIYNLNLDLLLNNLKEKLNNLMSNKQLDFNKTIQLTDWDKSQYNQGNTAFKLASFQYQFQNGTLNSDSILVQTDKLHVQGKGTINLSNHELNSSLQASLNSTNTEPSMQKTQQILGGYFPLVVSGTIEQPQVLPDFKIIIPLLMKTTLNKPIKQIKNKLKELIH